MSRNLKTKDEIFAELIDVETYKGRVFRVDTHVLDPNYQRIRGDIKKWADATFKSIYGYDRASCGESVHFAYIKLAKDESGKVCGIVGGKSSFHMKNNSDICFYDITKSKSKKAAAKHMIENKLNWYTDSVIFIKNVDDNNSKEAFSTEKELQKKFNLFG